MRCRTFVLGIVMLAGATVMAGGELEPPGPPSATGRTLQEIEPRTPIDSLETDYKGTYVITEPGSYYLTADIQQVTNEDAIAIQSSHVAIDLMGYSLIGISGSGYGIRVIAPFSFENVTIRNGFVRGWGDDGIELETVTNVLIEDVHVSNCGDTGIKIGTGIIKDCETVNNTSGIDIKGGSIIRCFVAGNSTEGVVLRGDQTGLMREVVATLNRTGVASFGAGWLIQDSVFSHNQLDGAQLYANNIVTNCRFVGNGTLYPNGSGVDLTGGGGNVVDGNVITGNDIGVEAIINLGEIVMRNVVKGNTASFSGTTGNHFAPLESLATSTNPWANISD